jgi:hypothetical protein
MEESKFFLDSLYLDLDSTYNSFIKDYDDFFRDSVFNVVKDSISISRLDSLNKMSYKIELMIENKYLNQKGILKSYFDLFESSIDKNKKLYTQCLDCEDKEDYYDQIEEYGDVLDSISGEFQDRMNDKVDSMETALSDSADEYMSKISDYGSNLMDNQTDEDEIITAGNENTVTEDLDSKYSKISIEADYYNHFTYRGRDNGIYQNSYSPVISYDHPAGFGFLSAFYFANNTPKPLDEVDLIGYYSFDFSDNLTGAFYLTHYFFKDSSSNAKSALTNTLAGEVNFTYPYFNFTPVLNLDFSKNSSEFSLFLFASSPITLTDNFLSGSFGIEPSITVIYGQQNDAFLTILKGKRGKIVNAPKQKNVFGVMDYELSFPLVFSTRYFSVKPYFNYVIPLNVIDNSSKNPFFTFMLEIIAPFYLK